MYQNNHQFLIALGSNKNLGPLKPLDILKKAIAELKQSEISLVSLSRFFESPAYPDMQEIQKIYSKTLKKSRFVLIQLLLSLKYLTA